MRKELVWAGVIGISFGLIIAFGAWRVRTSVATKEDGKPVPTATPQSLPGQFKITINKPDNFDVVTESPTNISGITKPLTWVVISTDEDDYLTQSGNDGVFSVDVDLTPGLNRLKATSVNIQGNVSSQDILAVYSASFQTNATDDANNTVAQKLAQSANPPKAYIGTVTDIADSTIQIKSTDSQIQQIETGTFDITVVNTKGTSNKTVKLTDIAIGDFIIAMGYVDKNDVLNTQRILIADSTAKTNIGVSMHNVDAVTKKTLTLSPTNGDEPQTITPDKNTSIESYSDGKIRSIKITDISKSDRMITVSDITGSPALSRSLFDLGSE